MINDHSNTFGVDGLEAGEETCVETGYRFTGVGTATIIVDPADEVEEESEDKNTLSFPEPESTACDIICDSARTVRLPNAAAARLE